MRGKKAPKRKIKVDPRFNRVDIAKLINKIMNDGKKTTAQKILYNAFFEFIYNNKKCSMIVEINMNLSPWRRSWHLLEKSDPQQNFNSSLLKWRNNMNPTMESMSG